MKTAILLVSFGTSYRKARENSLNCIFREVKEAAGQYEKSESLQICSIRQAYTSKMILGRLEKEGIYIHSVEQALKEALAEGAERLFVVATHMIPGLEYEKLCRQVQAFADCFREVKVTTAVLDREEDCGKIIGVMEKAISFQKEYEYILMGHGSEAEANCRYEQVNQALRKAGYENVRVASVEGSPNLEDAIAELKRKKEVKKVILYPFMVVAGDHAQNDMAGEEDSYVARLIKEGYDVTACVKGLGEFREFREIYLKKLGALFREEIKATKEK